MFGSVSVSINDKASVFFIQLLSLVEDIFHSLVCSFSQSPGGRIFKTPFDGFQLYPEIYYSAQFSQAVAERCTDC